MEVRQRLPGRAGLVKRQGRRGSARRRGALQHYGGAHGVMFLSVFDLFKIGIGPSSSHTMGPMTAAERFLAEIATGDWPRPANAAIDRLFVSLHGSLAFTGIGHGTD